MRRIDPGKGVVVQTIALPGGVDGLAVTHLDAPDRCACLRVCEAYEIDGVDVDRLVPGPWRDLDYQAELTARLFRAVPSVMSRPDDWAGAIGAMLGAPVTIESYGPTSADKKFV